MEEKTPFLTEDEKLQLRLNLTCTQRFRLLMQLIRISKKMKKATIIEPGKNQDGR